MTERVLVPFDGSPAARRAVEYACERFPEATLILLYVMDPRAEYSRHRAAPGYTGSDEFKNEREKGEHVLESILETIPNSVSVETELEAGDPARTIVEYTDANDVTHVVIGGHGKKGLASLFTRQRRGDSRSPVGGSCHGRPAGRVAKRHARGILTFLTSSAA